MLLVMLTVLQEETVSACNNVSDLSNAEAGVEFHAATSDGTAVASPCLLRHFMTSEFVCIVLLSVVHAFSALTLLVWWETGRAASVWSAFTEAN